MANYVGAACPVCEKNFIIDDDIVVCPICGTPHHRACYQNLGHCACEALHAQGHSWEPPHPPEEARGPENDSGGFVKNVCPSCGGENPSGAIFCETCGARVAQSCDNAASSAYTAAFGGVLPGEEIAGVSARDLALYVGTGSHYFLPRFRAISKGLSVSVNVPAFLNFLYFFYRKMYGVGLALLAFYAVMQIPAVFYTYELVGYFAAHISEFSQIDMSIMASFTPQRFAWTLVAIPVARYLMIAVSVLLSLFGNRIYLACAVRNIKKIHAFCERAPGGFDDGLYTEMLARRGRTSFGLVAVVIVGLFTASVLMSCIFMIPHMDALYSAMLP